MFHIFISGFLEDQVMPHPQSSNRFSEMLALHRVEMPSLRVKFGGTQNLWYHGPERDLPCWVRPYVLIFSQKLRIIQKLD